MKTSRSLRYSVAAAAFAALVAGVPAGLDAQQITTPLVPIGDSDLGGVVTGANGPEAGVWVIAETADLPTKFAKIVVTDDRGRYLHTRSAQGEIQRVGARLRPRRFGESAGRARQERRPEGRIGPEPGRGCANIIRQSIGIRCSKFRTRACFPGTGANGMPVAVEEPGPMARHRQDRRLLHLPPAGGQGDAHIVARTSASSNHRRMPGNGAFSQGRPAPIWSRTSASSTRSAR